MRWLDKFLHALWKSDDLKVQLLAFLGSDAEEFFLPGRGRLTRAEARNLLQELIPARIEVRGICGGSLAAVSAAPHVSFDNWSEYFCNRIARRFRMGWVVAKNFRDQDSRVIPVAIGRHIHVNRPTESVHPNGEEQQTERARRVHEDYVAALHQAANRKTCPIDLLIEFHSHHRTPHLEVATVGLKAEWARELCADYESERKKQPLLPELLIEPLHSLRLSGESTKRIGSLRPEVATRALHIEIPREARQSDATREIMCSALHRMVEILLARVKSSDQKC